MSKKPYYFSIIVILLGILVGFYYIYLLVYPFKTIKSIQPSVVVNKEVKAGEVLTVTKDYCKYTPVTARLIRNLIDGVSIPLPEVESALPEGCHIVNVIIPIPEYVPTGVYTLKTTSVYKVNPVREININEFTEQFKVIGKE